MTINAEVCYIDKHYKVAVLALEPESDMIMLPLSLLPDSLYAGQKLTITIEVR